MEHSLVRRTLNETRKQIESLEQRELAKDQKDMIEVMRGLLTLVKEPPEVVHTHYNSEPPSYVVSCAFD